MRYTGYAILRINGEEYEVLQASYRFERETDAKGRPSTSMFGGTIMLTIVSTESNMLFRNMTDKDNFKCSGAIIINPESEHERKLQFDPACIFMLEESVECCSGQAMITKLAIAPLRIKIDNSLYITRMWGEASYGWEKMKKEEEVWAKKPEKEPEDPQINDYRWLKTINSKPTEVSSAQVGEKVSIELMVRNFTIKRNISVLIVNKETEKIFGRETITIEPGASKASSKEITLKDDWKNMKLIINVKQDDKLTKEFVGDKVLCAYLNEYPAHGSWVKDGDGVYWDPTIKNQEQFNAKYKQVKGYSYVSDCDNANSYSLPNGVGKLIMNEWSASEKIEDGMGGLEIEMSFISNYENAEVGWIQTYLSNIPDFEEYNFYTILPDDFNSERLDGFGVQQSADVSLARFFDGFEGYGIPQPTLRDIPTRAKNRGAQNDVTFYAQSTVLANGTFTVSLGWGFTVKSKTRQTIHLPRILRNNTFFHEKAIQSLIRKINK